MKENSRYIKIFHEEFTKKTSKEKEKEVQEKIEKLIKENFGNVEQRKMMGSLIGSLVRSANDGNADAKSFLKELGKICSNWSNGNFNPTDGVKV